MNEKIEEEEEIGPLDFENELLEEEDLVEDLDPDHPLFKKLQEDLKKQLTSLQDNLDVEIKDKSTLKAKLTNEREQVGVELYSFQQQLAKLQANLTQTNEKRTTLESARLEQEKQLEQEKESYKQLQQDLIQKTKDYEKQRTELDKLNEVVQRLEQHNQEIINQVQVTKRETYKSEQSTNETEVSKQDQDLYINRLTQQLNDITSQLSDIEAQIEAQRNETTTAREALLQASLEMEKINFERNRLIQDWNSALTGVKKRNETLSQVEAAYVKQEEEIHTLQNEEKGLKLQIQEQQELQERNTSLINKVQNRVKYLDNKIFEVETEREKLQEQLQQFYKLCEEKEQEISRLIIERNNSKAQFKSSLKGTNEISNQIHEIEDKIIKHLTDQSNLKKDAVSTQRIIEQTREKINEKDKELNNIRNEIVRMKIDKINILTQAEKLERGLNEIVEELRQKDNLINQYEIQRRRNNNEIEKKQNEVDKLNRKYESLKDIQNGEEHGPLERKIRQIQNRIIQSDKIVQENQAEWIKKQNELVQLERTCENIEKENKTIQANIAVLTRKRDRIKNQLQSTEKEINKYQIQIDKYQREISRLGEQLSNSNSNNNNLLETNINFEADILESLQKKEMEAIKLESQIEQIVNVREDLADDLMETEKSILMLEKKIELANEMKEALDPNYGSSELNSMKKEISRMELRLKQIKKQQQVIIQEMEYALKRRETIANRGNIKKRVNKDKIVNEKSEINELRKEVKKINNETKKHEMNIMSGVELQKELTNEIEQLTQVIKDLQCQYTEIQEDLNDLQKSKYLSQTKLERLQAKNRLFQIQKVNLKSDEAFNGQYDNLKKQEDHIKLLIDTLEYDFPHLAKKLQLIKDKMFVV
ncbi:Coiled-coil domain-containing protein [Histomonas meleagridis]|uniref:Coiled-coil domain-containing protein 40 n=1 Tax=Histomonas meleagridis TaxID=135588 RepID=UPI003559D2A1|nr:Coiled-coil domain-containing protein [Histomonas meleagridis]KAH0798178.1 Coiled-coil domain-containing protein 40 [Histomonas meleagridis]